MRIEKKVIIYGVVIIAIASGELPSIAKEPNFACNRGNFFKKIAEETAAFIKDGVWIYRNLFSIDSAKIVTTTMPFYLITRFADEDMHQCFYDKYCHKNVRQFPSALIKGVDKTISATVFGAAALSIFSPNKRLRITSRVFAVGLVSGLFLKDVMKSAKTDANLRPWHECFSSVKRSYGGFPSGHMFEIVYMTTLFGLEYGLSAWIILGLFSGCMAAIRSCLQKKLEMRYK